MVAERRTLVLAITALILLSGLTYWYWFVQTPEGIEARGEVVPLPEARMGSDISVEEAIGRRRSVRSFTREPISMNELSQLLWAAQGITDKVRGFRAAPSAGALYPLKLYVVAGEGGVVKADETYLKAGVYSYRPEDHSLILLFEDDLRGELAGAAYNQMFVAEAPVVIVFTAIYQRTTGKYGERGVRYVHMEAGHAAENLCLQCVALDLGTVTVGAFDDGRVKELLRLAEESPLYVMPVGHPR